MRNTKLVVFGEPRLGTPLMLGAPSSALDLPLKILIPEGADGRTWVTYNSVAYLQAHHQVRNDHMKNVAGIEQLVEALTNSRGEQGCVAGAISGRGSGMTITSDTQLKAETFDVLVLGSGEKGKYLSSSGGQMMKASAGFSVVDHMACVPRANKNSDDPNSLLAL